MLLLLFCFFTERALELTALCLRYNPANYTVWWYRRQILSTLSKQESDDDDDDDDDNNHTITNNSLTYYDLERIQNDLDLASTLGGSNPKNYQVWYHRRSLLEYTFETSHENDDNIQIARDELKYIEQVLDEDAKNYHVGIS